MNQKNIVIKTYRGLPEEARDIREEVFVVEQKFQEEYCDHIAMRKYL